MKVGTLLLAIGLCACSKSSTDSTKDEPRQPPAVARDAATGSTKPTAKHPLPYWLFDTPAQAMAKVLETRPRVIGFGEYHEKAGGPRVLSPMKRFTALLDVLAPHATDLVFETWVADTRCGKTQKRVDKRVDKQMARPAHQENQMTALLGKAKKLRVRPHILRFSCTEYKGLLDAKKQVDYGKLLALLTKKLGELTTDIVKVRDKQLAAAEKKRAAKPDAPTRPLRRTVLIYGGALHNEKYPYDSLGDFSYVKAIEDKVGSYVEVDLFVPEVIRGNKRLSKEPFYPMFEALASPDKVVLIERGKHSYILIGRTNLATP